MKNWYNYDGYINNNLYAYMFIFPFLLHIYLYNMLYPFFCNKTIWRSYISITCSFVYILLTHSSVSKALSCAIFIKIAFHLNRFCDCICFIFIISLKQNFLLNSKFLLRIHCYHKIGQLFLLKKILFCLMNPIAWFFSTFFFCIKGRRNKQKKKTVFTRSNKLFLQWGIYLIRCKKI